MTTTPSDAARSVHHSSQPQELATVWWRRCSLSCSLALLWAFVLPLSGMRLPGAGSLADAVLLVTVICMLPQLLVRTRLALTLAFWLTCLGLITSSYFAMDASASRVSVLKVAFGFFGIYGV